MNREKVFKIWLSSVVGIGYKSYFQLMEFFKKAEEIYRAKEIDIFKATGKKNLTEKIVEAQKLNPFEYVERLQKLKVSVYTLEEEEYPSILREIHNPPVVLYLKGRLNLKDKFSIAMVGSRKATYYGKQMAQKLSYDLSERGITVVSGLARGIDTYSHLGALKGRGSTIAVLGCGINVVYPTENKKLMEQIGEEGLLVSEYPLDYPPLSQNFPLRNRIISGLSQGVVVVEAGAKSGALITAQFALEQGREVFAVPGNVTSAYSAGTNDLIKQGAKIVTQVEDILEEFSFREDLRMALTENEELSLTEDEKVVYEFIKEAPRDVEEISYTLNMKMSKLNSILTSLMLKGLIDRLPGNKYTKKIF
ncbi:MULTISPECIES: DNA-processing protein DprA [Caldanaerobacter]|uniref:Predicted Rossmann-fold nucleotide-binding protein involved in DNA uptake n=4 Tax=Caldanaerobacter subterraneus TaxID=911092 RepID=Q8R9Y0_CALS4|nr:MULTISPECIES: DNA-processing protein DprA [Caldanaerobacter]TCO67808.1 DNA processing protein [Caldanaerobacter subterraneus]AAM24672.1 predicted Rossmann-fold nucleotide-binding protein involved in DNA uptake [Caldanaerobacter subterraneus subsp. tengcongensis MB4]KKC29651.1 Rossmann-fold nucleotide-binding protein involved in DNA uptake [Caldanaerobacter subterraneus subsp. pacificus DSM 12653]MCS3915766.1 DNA processing protein [Caldanaerobacter subterraneus subsp. tengcongensis MB4]MDI3